MPAPAERNAKGFFARIMYLSESSITSEDIIADLDDIAKVEDEKTRNALIQEYYLALYKNVLRDAYIFRARASNDISILKEEQNIMLLNSGDVLNALTTAFSTYFTEKSIVPCEGKKFMGCEYSQIRDTIHSVCKEFTALDTWREAGRDRDIDTLIEMYEDFEAGVNKTNFKYSTVDKMESDEFVEEMFVMHEARAEEYAKLTWRDKLRHPIDAIKTVLFLRNMNKLFKKVGFDKDTHGVETKERFSKEPSSFLKVQMDKANEECKMIEANAAFQQYLKDNPPSTVAQEKIEAAYNYYDNSKLAKSSFANKVSHIIDRYNLPDYKKDTLLDVATTHRGLAERFDQRKDTESLTSYSRQKFYQLYSAFFTAAFNGAAKAENIDIKQILKDANDFLVTELQTYSVVYNCDEFKDFANGGMLLKGAQLEAIKRETANKLNNKFSPEEVQRIQNEMNEYITDYNENREQNYELEMKMLEKNDVSLMRESVKIVLILGGAICQSTI